MSDPEGAIKPASGSEGDSAIRQVSFSAATLMAVGKAVAVAVATVALSVIATIVAVGFVGDLDELRTGQRDLQTRLGEISVAQAAQLEAIEAVKVDTSYLHALAAAQSTRHAASRDEAVEILAGEMEGLVIAYGMQGFANVWAYPGGFVVRSNSPEQFQALVRAGYSLVPGQDGILEFNLLNGRGMLPLGAD